MPTKDQLSPGVVNFITGTTPSTISVPKAVGTLQSISSLNYGKPLQPGVYRCNPVTIYRGSGTSTGALIQGYRGSTLYQTEGNVSSYAAGSSYGVCGSGLLAKATWSDARAQEAINKAYAKLMSPDLDLGVMLGELKETLAGLVNPLSALRKFVKKNGFPKRKETLDMLSGTWLEWRYGIRPLLSDIQAIYEHVTTQLNGYDGKMSKRGGRTAKMESITNLSKAMTFNQAYCTFKGTIKTTTWYTARVAFKYTRPLTWQERYGLDIYSLPGIAYELTTLSFVLDWFLSVGTWLQALKALNPVINVLGVAVTQRTNIEMDYRLLDALLDGKSCVKQGDVVTSEMEYMMRKCLSPGFNTVTPALNSKVFDVNRTLDALTLLWQQLPKKR